MSIAFDFTTLDYPAAAVTTPAAINDFGEVVGSYDPRNINEPTRGFVLSDGRLVTVKPPPAATEVLPLSVNNRGDIAGQVVINGVPGSFLQTGGKFQIIPPLAGHTLTLGSINDLRQITFTEYATQFTTSYIYRNGQYSPFAIPGAFITLPQGISDVGQVVGIYFDDDFAGHNFIDTNGSVKTFTLPGAVNTLLGISMNLWGEVAGNATLPSLPNATFGFVSFAGQTIFLKYPGAIATSVVGLNDLGQVVGEYINPDASSHGFVATPRVDPAP